ncbi:MAG: protein kinase [Myxococcota bacterium]
MSACPEETEMLQLIEGQLDPAHRERLEAHIDTCAACAEWLAAMAAVLAPEPDDLQASSSDGYAPAPTPQETLIDERYRIEAMVGAGAMGVVYVADDQRLSRQVALKLMRPDILEPELRARVQERMLREAQSLATLAHPNVVSVHDVGSWHERVFIAMEYVRGASLSQWIRDRDPPWRDILDAWLQACDGLAAAHDAGLVHRDIKPDNLLVGDDGRVRLTDFGLAGAFEDLHAPRDPARSTAKGVWATRTGLLIGTPAYMSPEQLDGHRATAQSRGFSVTGAAL